MVPSISPPILTDEGWTTRAVFAIMAGVKQQATFGTEFYKCGLQTLVYHGQQCIANDGDYIERVFTAIKMCCYCALCICCSFH